jgi:hypothetical protein
MLANVPKLVTAARESETNAGCLPTAGMVGAAVLALRIQEMRT